MAGLLLDARLEGADIPDPAAFIPPELESAVTESSLLLERVIKLKTPIGVTAVARGSIAHDISRGTAVGRGVRIRAEFGSPAKHVPVLDKGRRAGARRPPIEALELWVRRRIKVDRETGKRLTRARARGIAFVIARAIGQRGMDALEMFDEAAKENEAKIQRIFDRAGLNVTVHLSRGSA